MMRWLLLWLLGVNVSNAYNKTEINAFLDTKPDETEVDAKFVAVDAAIASFLL